MNLEDWEREQDWRFRFWTIVLWPEFQWQRFKIRLHIWLLRRMGFEECPECGYLTDGFYCGACGLELPVQEEE